MKEFFLILGITFMTQFVHCQTSNTNYSYDDLNRLVYVESYDNVNKGYVYDDIGNRIQIEVEVLGVDEEVLRNTITVYPNPTTGLISIKLPEKGAFLNPFIDIYDIQGRLIRSVSNNQVDLNRLTINLEGLTVGVYLLRLHENGQFWSQLIIKK